MQKQWTDTTDSLLLISEQLMHQDTADHLWGNCSNTYGGQCIYLYTQVSSYFIISIYCALSLSVSHIYIYICVCVCVCVYVGLYIFSPQITFAQLHSWKVLRACENIFVWTREASLTRADKHFQCSRVNVFAHLRKIYVRTWAAFSWIRH